MSTTLKTQWSVHGTRCTLKDGTLVANITYHAHGMYEVWPAEKFQREGFPFLWSGREAAEFAVLALASDAENDPMVDLKPKSSAQLLLEAAQAVEKILAPFIDTGMSAPHMIEAVQAMRDAIKRSGG